MVVDSDITTSTLVFFVNGKKIVEDNPDPECLLITYLRERLYLCGTKLGCGEGGCGACTVMVSKVDRGSKVVKHIAVNACLMPLCSLHGCAVTTVEGIGSSRTRLHPVQERIAKAHGSQCGFCTPGIVMSMYALLRSMPKPSMKDMEVAFQGNLCRCTGYRPIIEGYKTFTKEFSCGMGDKCCKLNGGHVQETLFVKSEFAPYDSSQEPIFPPELKISDVLDRQNLLFKGPRVAWYRPTQLDDLLDLKEKYPDAKIVVGNTEVGVEVKFKNVTYPIRVSPVKIPEMVAIQDTEHGIYVGAAATLADVESALKKAVETQPEEGTRFYRAVVDMFQYFAGKQIRNVGSLGGNVMTGSPISDLCPLLSAMGVELVVRSSRKGGAARTLRMGAGFFTGYRKNQVESHEVLIGFRLPKTTPNQYVVAFKQAKRRDDDIAIVTSAFNLVLKPGTDIVDSIDMAFGGMAPTVVLAPGTSQLAKGERWNEELVEKITEHLCSELPLAESAPGGMVAYRRSLVLSLFFKAFLSISQQLEKSFISAEERSGADVFETQIPKSTQLFEKVDENQPKQDPIGRPQVFLSALKQATGEAVYCDDIPVMENELHLGLVQSTRAHAKIVSIDASDALKIRGVHTFISSKDVSVEANRSSTLDDETFATEVVHTEGQIIGAIVAENKTLAKRAAKLVKVTYEDISPVIVTIDDAIEHSSFFPGTNRVLTRGDVDKGFSQADHIIEGSVRMGAQEHFYLEPHASVAMPKDNDELEVFCTTQHPAEVQKLVSSALGIPWSKVACRAKRLGGGFGGKESRSFLTAVPAAIAAYQLRRPVRCVLDRDEDMMLTGFRHPFLFKYRVGCTKEGRIVAAEVDCYNNGGWTADHSASVMFRAMLHIDNWYTFPNMRVRGFSCKTNLPSNTAFRGFGAPQGMFACEHMIRDIARVVGKDFVDIQTLNMYKRGDRTFCDQDVEYDTFQKIWKQCMDQSDFYNQRLKIDAFNQANRWRKRGISVVPTKFGISFGSTSLTQTGAFVNVYQDGSVLLFHGGVEIGQGLHTKMIQIAARVLRIPPSYIHISETATDKVPNTPPTGGSMGSDIQGMAVLDACKKLYDRMAGIREKFPDASWEKMVTEAYLDRVSLSATGFYKGEPVTYDAETNKGRLFDYTTNGVAVSVVEIDCLTGDHQVFKTDIVMDVGSSLNPAVDIGQIEGAFMQGYGYWTMEELVYSPKGNLYSRGPGMYKIPSFSNIPTEFNVSLLTGSPNPRAVYSSKGIGEPPLFLGASVFFAIKEAIAAARNEQGITGPWQLIAPATSARIRMACEDRFTKLIKDSTAKGGDNTPWNVVL